MLYPQQTATRNKYDLSGIWDFQIDPQAVGEAAGWAMGLPKSRPMAVPGSWNEQYEDLFNYLDLGWYVKRSFVPASWQGQRVFIRVGSAPYFANVFVNGTKVGSHEGGHLPFAFEITELIQWDAENVFAISVENELKPERVPSGNTQSPFGMMSGYPNTTFDFFPFAGIHRPVVLYSVPQTFIDDVTVVTEVSGSEGQVAIAVKLNEAIGGVGTAVLTDTTTNLQTELSFSQGKATATLTVSNARLWSDTDPHLYTLTLRTASDQYSMQIGIRTIAVAGGQIVLNGRPIKLNGYGRHEDFIASGKGLNLPLMVKDYQLMRWTGANSYRTSHYPYSEEEMQMADREGFLIIDEIPTVSMKFEDDAITQTRLDMALKQLDELITRDKNHPSVVMWSVANEPMPKNFGMDSLGGTAQEDPSVARGQYFLDTLLHKARELDPTRLATVVGVMGGPESWLRETDVACINRYWGWYTLGGQLDVALPRLEAELDGLWQNLGKPIIMTEFGADTMAGMHGQPNVMWTEEYQADYIRGHLEVAARKPFVAGMQVWNFADFAAVQSIIRVGGLNMKGVFTRIRTPKMAAHVLREFWVHK